MYQDDDYTTSDLYGAEEEDFEEELEEFTFPEDIDASDDDL